MWVCVVVEDQCGTGYAGRGRQRATSGSHTLGLVRTTPDSAVCTRACVRMCSVCWVSCPVLTTENCVSPTLALSGWRVACSWLLKRASQPAVGKADTAAPKTRNDQALAVISHLAELQGERERKTQRFAACVFGGWGAAGRKCHHCASHRGDTVDGDTSRGRANRHAISARPCTRLDILSARESSASLPPSLPTGSDDKIIPRGERENTFGVRRKASP